MPALFSSSSALRFFRHLTLAMYIIDSYAQPARQRSGDSVDSVKLYPENFSVFGAYEGQQFTIGHVVMIVAKFPASAFILPEPEQLGPDCNPTMLLNVRWNGGTCYNVTAAASVKRLEAVFGFSFADDPTLQTDTASYNHWVFPLYVVDGMVTSRLQLKGLTIPASCNSRADLFENTDLIAQSEPISPRVLIDTQSPAIVSIHTGKSAGVYTLGAVISIVVEFSKDVVLSDLPDPYSSVYLSGNNTKRIPYGVPLLELNSGAQAPLRGYDSPRSRAKVAFLYEVGLGEETPPGEQLDVLPGTAIQLNGGAIMAEGTGLDVNMSSMPVPRGEGSLSHPTANRIRIARTGAKFPPLKYDPALPPAVAAGTDAGGGAGVGGATLRSGRGAGDGAADALRKARRPPTVVEVRVEVRGLVDVGAREQAAAGDVVLAAAWTDRRLRDPAAPPVTEYAGDDAVAAARRIWTPRVGLVNWRDGQGCWEDAAGAWREPRIRVYSTGRVEAQARAVGRFAGRVDAAAFPFDAHALVWQVSSLQHGAHAVRLVGAGGEWARNESRRLAALPSPLFRLAAYAHGEAEEGGLLVTVRATRRGGAAVVTLVLPLLLVCAALCIAALQDPGSPGRVRSGLQAVAVLVALSPLVVHACPPVGRPTRVHLLLAFAYALALAHLLVAAYLAAVTRALRALRQAASAARRDAVRLALSPADQRGGCGADTGGPWGGPDAAALEPGSGTGDAAGGGDAGEGGRDVLGGMLDALGRAAFARDAAAAEHGDAPQHPKAAAGDDSDGAPDEAPRNRGWQGDVWQGGVRKGSVCVDEALDWAAQTGPGGPMAGCGDGDAVRMLCGLAAVRQRNARAWRRHVQAVDGALRVCGPGLCTVAAVAILGGAADVLLPPMPSASPWTAL